MTRAKRLVAICLVLVLVVAVVPAAALASSSVYENAYNIYGAIAYANKYYENYNPNYVAYDSDCTNFVSQCIADPEAGGIKQEGYFTKDGGGYNNHPWTVTNDLYKYLMEQGYNSNSFSSWQDSSVAPLFCRPGDLVFYDWGTRGGPIDGLGKNDGRPDHAAICVDISEEGIPLVAAHTANHKSDPIILDNGNYGEYMIYVIQLSDTAGLIDVTSRYAGKTIALKSLEANQYVSSNTDQDTTGINATANRSSASILEYFDVIAGDYGAVGFKARGNGNYLSARIDQNKNYAYIQAAYGQNYTKPQSWESFRIFEKGGIQYIQSQANGKWMQAAVNETDTPLKAAGAHASTWERFKIEIVNPSSGGNTGGSGGGDTGGTGGNTGGGSVAPPQIKTYTIFYNANGGIGAPNQQSKTQGHTLALSNEKPTRAGYLFLGWSTGSSAASASYYPGSNFSIDSNTTLYAVWKAVPEKASLVVTTDGSLKISLKNAPDGYSYMLSIDNDGHTWEPTIIDSRTSIDSEMFSGERYSISLLYNGQIIDSTSFIAPGEKWDASQAVRSPGIVGSWVPKISIDDSVYHSERALFLSVVDMYGAINTSETMFEIRAYNGGVNYQRYAISQVSSLKIPVDVGIQYTFELWDYGENSDSSPVKMDSATYSGQQDYMSPPTPEINVDSKAIFLEWTQEESEGYYLWRHDWSLPYENAKIKLNNGEPVYNRYIDNEVIAGVKYSYQLQSVRTATERAYDGYGESVSVMIPVQSKALELYQPSQWAQESIIKAYDMDLIPEYMMRDYSLTTTRIDFVRLAYNAIENKCGWMQQVLLDKGLVEDLNSGVALVFTDVPRDCGYDDYNQYRVAALRALGIITGVGDNKFEPNRAITRQEAAVLLSRVHSFIRWGEVRENYIYEGADNRYADDQLIAKDWASTHVYNMRAIDVMNGVGNNLFNPQGPYTIEQSIVTFVRLLGISNRE